MTAVSRRPLTKRQEQILQWIRDYIAAHGFSPTVREVCDAFRFRSVNGAMCHMLPLRRKGWLVWQDNKPRTLREVPE